MSTIQKILIASVVVLILINLGLLATVWFQLQGNTIAPRPDLHRRHEMHGQFLQRELNLSDSQTRQFAELNRSHREKMMDLNRNVRRFQRQLHRNIIWRDSVHRKIAADSLFSLQKRMQSVNLEYLDQLASLCDDDQREKLLQLIDEVLESPEGIPSPMPSNRH